MKGKPNFSLRFLFSKNMYKRYGFILKFRKKTSQKKAHFAQGYCFSA